MISELENENFPTREEALKKFPGFEKLTTFEIRNFIGEFVKSMITDKHEFIKDLMAISRS